MTLTEAGIVEMNKIKYHIDCEQGERQREDNSGIFRLIDLEDGIFLIYYEIELQYEI